MDYQNFDTLGVNLNRQKYGPLDISSVFTSQEDLDYYVSMGTASISGVSNYWKNITPYPYEGQIVSLNKNGIITILNKAEDIKHLIDIAKDSIIFPEFKRKKSPKKKELNCTK